MGKDADMQDKKRYSLWFSAFVQVGFLAGATWGWANLKQILKRIGYWTNDPSTEETNYGLVFTVASWFAQAGRIFVGVYLDRFGVKVTTVTSCVMSCGGLVILALSNTGMNLVYPGLILISLGGPGIQLATQSVSNLFANKAMVMSSLSWALQLSTLWFLVCNILNKGGINASLLFMFYALVGGLLCVWCWLIYPSRFISGERGKRRFSRKSMLITTGRYGADFLENGSLRQMMFSIDYVLLNIWYSFYILYLQFYVMTVGSQTELITGENMAVEFNTALCTVSAAGIILGFAMDKLGFGPVLLFNIAFSAGACLCINSSQIGVQWLGFILYVLSRVSTYGMFYAFIGINFGFKHFGTLAGVGLFISGCFSLFQYLCLYIVENDAEVDYKQINIFMALLVVASGGLYALWLFTNEMKCVFKEINKAEETPELNKLTGSTENYESKANASLQTFK